MKNPLSKSLIKNLNVKKYGWWIFFLVILYVTGQMFFVGRVFTFCNESEHILPLPTDLVGAKVKLIFEKGLKNITVFNGKGFAQFSPRCSPLLDQVGRFITFYDPQGHYENSTLEHLSIGTVLTLDKMMAQRDYGIKAAFSGSEASIYWILKDNAGTSYILADYESDMVEVYKKDGSSLRDLPSFYMEENVFSDEVKKINSILK